MTLIDTNRSYLATKADIAGTNADLAAAITAMKADAFSAIWPHRG